MDEAAASRDEEVIMKLVALTPTFHNGRNEITPRKKVGVVLG